jgi:hypothetical protein
VTVRVDLASGFVLAAGSSVLAGKRQILLQVDWSDSSRSSLGSEEMLK